MNVEGKLTQKDVDLWCSTHRCNEKDCKYMKDYCHIKEFISDDCNDCMKGFCTACNHYK